MTASAPATISTWRDPLDPSVLVLDGYGLSLTVSRGHLILKDGLGRHRRERRLPRAQRTVTRIVILGHTGHLSLEAVRWCHDTGLALVHLEPEGTLLLHAGPNGRDDARLRRAQAFAATTDTGLAIAKHLMSAKLLGQATVIDAHALPTLIAGHIRHLAEQISTAPDPATVRDLEARAGNLYFGAWSGTITCRFAHNARPKVPDAWTIFAARGSTLHRGGRSPRSAADPINALLNYGYALLETEATLALRAVGLDPGLGIIHTDKLHRDSLTLDVMEPVRPILDDLILTLLARRHLSTDDVTETPRGGCRLLPPLTTELAGYLPHLAHAVAPYAEHVANTLAHASPTDVPIRTPLTRAKTRAAQTPRDASVPNSPPPQPRPNTRQAPRTATTCRTCGLALTNPRRALCPSCWNVTRRDLATALASRRIQTIADARANGNDPTTTPHAKAKKAQTLSANRRAQRNWQPSPQEAALTKDWFTTTVLPALADVPLNRIATATGVSSSAASRLRNGKLLPHRRHWLTLHHLNTTTEAP